MLVGPFSFTLLDTWKETSHIIWVKFGDVTFIYLLTMMSGIKLSLWIHYMRLEHTGKA